MKKLNILLHPADQMGCGMYRVILPGFVLKQAGHNIDVQLSTVDNVSKYDIIVFQRIHKQDFMPVLKQYRAQAPKASMVMDIDDDLYRLPHIFTKDDCDRFTEACNFMDQVIVSTEFLKERLVAEGVTSRVVVRRNMVCSEFWLRDVGARNPRSLAKPRVLLSGAMGHNKNGDLNVLKNLPKKLNKKVQLIALGDELPKLWGRHKVITYMPWVPVNEFPAYVKAINADYWLAPLNPNLEFNKSKSNIKYLEATMAGAVLLAQRDAFPYRDLPGVIYYDTADELARIINTTKDADYLALYLLAAHYVRDNYIMDTHYGRDAIIESWSKNGPI